MGTINHNAIIATTWDRETADSLQEWIDRTFAVGRILRSAEMTNDYQTFIFVPDGSKERWDESDLGDTQRDLFVARLAKDNYEDDSSPWDWVEVGFGEYGQKVIRGNCKNCFNDAPYATDDTSADPGVEGINQ